MENYERKAWAVAGVILLLWAVGFTAWMMLTPYPAVLYP